MSGSDTGAAHATDLLELDIGPAAHGGHCVARSAGRVVFVRHTLPGERVRAVVTDRTSRYWRADAVEILHASPDRVDSVWPDAGPGGVGGGELSHVALPAQRRWKAEVIVDVLARIGRIDAGHEAVASLQVEAAPGDEDRNGLGYRTRVELVADAAGRPGMFGHRSNTVHPVTSLPLAHHRIADLQLLSRRWPAGSRITAVAPSDSPPVVLVDGEPTGKSKRVREVVAQTYRYRVHAAGFWQVHDQAPALLTEAVLGAAQLHPGGRVLDLYSGAGLFSVPLAATVGPQGRVDAVEGSDQAVADARRNAHGLDQLRLHQGRVADLAGQLSTDPIDVVVLDPPRAGAGKRVLESLLRARPRRIVYVACDPAALARDLASARAGGYRLAHLKAFDLFPHTHHVECVATMERAEP